MKKTFGHRVMVVGLIASLIANPAWAMIMVEVKPAAPTSRAKTTAVNGHGTLMVMGDDAVTRWNWKFGFGTKSVAGVWQFEVEEAFTPNPTSWAKNLNAPPWIVYTMTPPPPMPPVPISSHFARVTREWALNPLGPTYFDETGTHLVTN